MTVRQWVFNGVLTGLYCMDMSVGYCVLSHLKKQFK
jgi:hypothetical protein